MKIDCEKGEGVDIAKEFGVRGYPTYITVDAERRVTGSWIGYDGPASFASRVADIVADPRTVEVKQAAYDEAPTPRLARILAHHLGTSYDFAGAARQLMVARGMESEDPATYTDDILMYMYYGSDGFTFDEVDAEARPLMTDASRPVADRLELTMMVAMVAKGKGAAEGAAWYLETAMDLPFDPEDEDVVHSRSMLAVDHALLVDEDKEKAVALKREGMPEGWQDDAKQLNSYAWWCFENQVNMEEALELALRGVELADEGQAKANVLDTVAELCNALGNCGEAIDYIKQAIEQQPDRDYYKRQLAKFEEALAEADKG